MAYEPPSAVLAATSAAAVPRLLPAAPAVPAAAEPTEARPAPKPAPPYAPNPAIKPFCKLPVANAVPPPTRPADIKGVNAPPDAIDKPAPISVGSNEDKKPASGKPVSGLIVKDPPCAIAKD